MRIEFTQLGGDIRHLVDLASREFVGSVVRRTVPGAEVLALFSPYWSKSGELFQRTRQGEQFALCEADGQRLSSLQFGAIAFEVAAGVMECVHARLDLPDLPNGGYVIVAEQEGGLMDEFVRVHTVGL